jgi:hypothetical protein
MPRYSREYLDFLKRGEKFSETVLCHSPMTVKECIARGLEEGFSEEEVHDFLGYLDHLGALNVKPPRDKMH